MQHALLDHDAADLIAPDGQPSSSRNSRRVGAAYVQRAGDRVLAAEQHDVGRPASRSRSGEVVEHHDAAERRGSAATSRP